MILPTPGRAPREIGARWPRGVPRVLGQLTLELLHPTLEHGWRRNRCPRLQWRSGGRTGDLTAFRARAKLGLLMATEGADVRELRDAYGDARAEIEKFDGTEREIGLATLRLEATHTYKQLATTGSVFTDDDLAPLEKYVQNLIGGEGAERAMVWLEARAQSMAKQVFTSILSSIATGAVTGTVLLGFGVIATVSASAHKLGVSIGSVIAASGTALYFFSRTVYQGGEVGHDAASKGWAWASTLGSESDRALAKARSLEVTLWRAVGASPWQYSPFTNKVRLRAQIVVAGVGALVVAGLMLVAASIVIAVSHPHTQTIPRPTGYPYVSVPGSPPTSPAK